MLAYRGERRTPTQVALRTGATGYMLLTVSRPSPPAADRQAP
jgi:hypothetical protein